jgi:transposase InsO family protein
VGLCQTVTTKTAIGAADLMNDRVLSFYLEQQVPLLRVLTDRGGEYCGRIEHHDYQLYLAVNDIDHTRTKAQSPQTNGICERFHKTILNEFYQVAFRKKIYKTLEEIQVDHDAWLNAYNHERTHQGECAVVKRRWRRSRMANKSVERSSSLNSI